MPMSRKHYTAIAGRMSELMWKEGTDPKTFMAAVVTIADVCEEDNPRFDRQKFYTACTNNLDAK